jgi:hypothetical protein
MLDGDNSSDVSDSETDEAPARRSQRSANLPPAIPLLVPIPEEPLPPVATTPASPGRALEDFWNSGGAL